MREIYEAVAQMHREQAAMGVRTFDNVDLKLAEADFLLEKLEGTRGNVIEAGFYFSAFVSAARSVTFALQTVMAKAEGFTDWYAERQRELSVNLVAKYFVNRRNEATKTGERAIFSAERVPTEDGGTDWEYFFWPPMSDDRAADHELVPVIRTVRQYMESLTELIAGCYEGFGPVIDPDRYYTEENLARLGITIEDVEESLGFPGGWTYLDGSHEDPLREPR